MTPDSAKLVLDDVVNSVLTHCHVPGQDFRIVRDLVCEELSRLIPIRPQIVMAVGEEFKTDLVNTHDWIHDRNSKVFAWSIVDEKLARHPEKKADTLRRFHAIVGTRPTHPDEIVEFGFRLTPPQPVMPV